MPTISVITICFNDLEELLKTIATVNNQTLPPTEHLIINASTKPDIANWFITNPQPQFRRLVNMENLQIAGSFNKGIEEAKAEYIHLLNSGDLYATNEVLKTVEAFLNQNPKANWISAKLKTLRNGILVEIGKPFDATQLYKGMRSISHPTWFVKKTVYKKVGDYKAAYKIAMDYDMLCRIKDEPYAFLNFTTTYFDNTGISSVKYLDSLKENIVVYENNFGYSLKCRLWQFRQKLLYKFLQTNLGKWMFGLKKKLGLENV